MLAIVRLRWVGPKLYTLVYSFGPTQRGPTIVQDIACSMYMNNVNAC